jgi:LysM repeat protein
MLDKNRPISRFNNKLLALSTRMHGSKVNIWLNVALYSVKLVLFYAVLLSPITASAGVFSFFADMIAGKEADAQVRQTTTQTMALLEANLGPSATSPVGGGEIAIVSGTALMQETGVIGTQADLVESKSTRISLYVVKKGNTLSEIAEMFDVTVNTIKWANNITGPIREGDELVILPIPGVSHVVKKGDTIESISKKYKADIRNFFIGRALYRYKIDCS